MGDMADLAMEQAMFEGLNADLTKSSRGKNLKEALADDSLVASERFPGLMLKNEPVSVVGLPFPNPDGSSRRAAAEELEDGDLVVMVREPNNPFDHNAVMVFRAHGEWPEVTYNSFDQFGYLPKGLAAIYAPMMDEGLEVFGTFASASRKPDTAQITVVRVFTGVLSEA